MNMYSYVGGDPVNFTDPLGLAKFKCSIDGGEEFECEGDGSNFGFNDPFGDPFGGFRDGPPSPFFDVGVGGPGSAPGAEDGETGADRKQQANCSIPISDAERQAAASGDRRAFWESRAARGDPIGQTALDILNNRGFGATANSSLTTRLVLQGRNPITIGRVMQQIGVDLLNAHVTAIERFAPQTGVLSPKQIAIYHHDVFARYGLPANTFGGTPLFGALWEADVTQSIWYRKCQG